ncbi:N-acetylglucosamine kinase [Lysinibacillus sp. NPDC096418]|uniref:N-acetylglucosamine kinase n=1 Tax=Lysinibacillus sp. NPDC096418 TaxID=3364138 RepID=UPI0038278BCB
MYVLAIDGGGTKTTAVISDENGNVYAKLITKRSNPTAIGKQQFEHTIRSIMQELQLQNEQAFEAVKICFAGLSGVKEKSFEAFTEEIMREYLGKDVKIVVENDALIALYSGTLGQEGIVQIAGTGAITMGYDKQHSFLRVGGWGYLFDDEGSGYDLGVQALKAVFQAYDGRAAETILARNLCQHFNVENVPQLIECVYNEGHPRANISPLSIYVTQAAQVGDPVANAILDEASSKFLHAINTCYTKLTWDEEAVPVVLAGGVFSNTPLFIERLKQLAIAQKLPFKFLPTLMEPIGGAVVGGLRAMDIVIADNFAEVFHESYAQFQTHIK